MSNECKHDENGRCTVHGPGTQSDIDSSTRLVDSVTTGFARFGAELAEIGGVLTVLNMVMTEENDRRVARGEAPFASTEQRLLDICRSTANNLIEQLKALKALREEIQARTPAQPSASTETSATAN